MHLPLLRSLALALAAACNVSDAAGLPANALVAAVCAGHPEPFPPGTELRPISDKLGVMQPSGDPYILEASCRMWRSQLRDVPNSRLEHFEMEAKVAASLLWLRRPLEAEPIFASLVEGFLAEGRPDMASGNAAMLAAILLQRGRETEALAWSRRGVELLPEPTEALPIAQYLALRINHVRVLGSLRQYDEALTMLQKLVTEVEGKPDLRLQAAALHGNKGALMRRLGKLDEAVAAYRDEEAVRRQTPDGNSFDLAGSLSNQASVLMALARWDEAELALREALQAAQAGEAGMQPDMSGQGPSTREALSQLLLSRGDPQQALQYAEQAQTMMARRPEAKTPRGARPWRRIADAQLALGQLGEALQSYRKAMAPLSEQASDGDSLNHVRLSMARAHLELRNPEAAQEQLDALDADLRPSTQEERVRRLTLRAELAIQRGQTAEALRAWNGADELLAAQGLAAKHPERRVLSARRCESGSTSACSALAGALEPAVEAQVQLALARRAKQDGRRPDAEAAARKALQAATAAGQTRLQWPALVLLAELQHAARRPAAAILFGKLALSQLQQLRGSLDGLGPGVDLRYLEDKAPFYRMVADWLIGAGRLPEALEVLRQLKAHEQAQFQERSAVAISEFALSPAELRALAPLKVLLTEGDGPEATELRQLAQREQAQRISPKESQRLAQLRDRVARQQATQEQRLTQALVLLQAQSQPRGAGATPSGMAARTDVLQISLLASAQRLSVIAHYQDAKGKPRARLRQLDWPVVRLNRAVAAWRDALALPGDELPAESKLLRRELGQAIHQIALQSGARSQRLQLWLDGPLRYLPPALLWADEQPLAMRWTLEVLSPRWTRPGAVSAAIARPPTAGSPALLAFGVTRALQGLPALPAVAEELCGIVQGEVLGLDDTATACAGKGRGAMPGQARLNAEFTEASLREATAAPSKLLHLGTHFVLRPGNINQSWLLLGDGARLALGGLRQFQAAGALPLVTLSACETGVPGSASADGREVDGLAGVWLDRGAEAVLASLWRVEDQATARFMQRFYAALAQAGVRPDQALRQTQRESMAAGEPARVWAAFVLMRGVSI